MTPVEIPCPVCGNWKGPRETEDRGEGKATSHVRDCPMSVTGRAHNNAERFKAFGDERAAAVAYDAAVGDGES